MAIRETPVIDKIEVLENGTIQVRRADKVFRDDVEIASTFHRHVIAPGDDLSNENERVAAIAQVTWTPKVVSDYKATVAAAVLAVSKDK